MHKFKFAVLGIAALALAGCSETVGQKQGLGTLLGAVAGGVAGAQVGKGRGKVVAVGVGTLLGALIGSEIGRSLDRADQLAMQHTTQSALETVPSGTTNTWHNPDSGNRGTITPTPDLPAERRGLLPRVHPDCDGRWPNRGGLRHRLPPARRQLANHLARSNPSRETPSRGAGSRWRLQFSTASPACAEPSAAWRADGLTVALVPTMGALHEGHMALVRAARAHGGRTVVSLFVNPTQFAPDEDFALYPRDPADDLAKLAEAGVEAAFMPPTDAIYPPGFATSVHVDGVTAGLESATRPHFFHRRRHRRHQASAPVPAGCRRSSAKRIISSSPQCAAWSADLDIPCRIEAVPTVRDADGLALSSRNAYLSAEERRVAPRLFEVLSWMAAALSQGAKSADAVANGTAALSAAGFTPIDYLAVCDAETLAPVESITIPARVLARRMARRDAAYR